MTDPKALLKSIENMARDGENTQGQLMVLTCAVAALVRSHPEPAGFAAEFWRVWQLAGSQHSNDANDGPGYEGIVEVLEVLEDACAVPLGIRPGK
jgi:hypothetical protein